MKQWIVRAGKRIIEPPMHVWRRIPLRLQGHIFVALPLLSILISAILALVGNYQRAGIETALQRHVQTVNASNIVLTLLVNAETGMRGYLLTRRDAFLQPYTTASEQLPSALANLQALADTEPGAAVRQERQTQVAQIQALVDQQMTDLAWQQQHEGESSSSSTEMYNHLTYGKQLMDALRDELTSMQTQEAQLLTERLQEINAIRQRDYLAVFLTLGVGVGTRLLARYLFDRGITWRIETLVTYIRSLRQGHAIPLSISGKRDALGDLEHEILALDVHLIQLSDGDTNLGTNINTRM